MISQNIVHNWTAGFDGTGSHSHFDESYCYVDKKSFVFMTWIDTMPASVSLIDLT
jgi:hypothetical protein